MSVEDANLPWDDPRWQEPKDNLWQRRLRQQQARWRQTRLNMPAGPRVGGDRLVSSMLPLGVGFSPNLMSAEAVDAATSAIDDLRSVKRPGLIQEERLKRNLLSSQPLCFNLFGYLSAYPAALQPWVRGMTHTASSIESVQLEWAPSNGHVGGSAFDAFITYTTDEGNQGFLGVEVKYAENLSSAQRDPASAKYFDETVPLHWLPGAAEHLDRTGLRQFWYNQLLGQAVLAAGEFSEGAVAVVALAEDQAARDATVEVSRQLHNQPGLQFASIEDVLRSVVGHDGWRDQFSDRYLPRTP